MVKHFFRSLFIFLLALLAFYTYLYAKGTEGAKSSFESGKDVGISYKIILITKDGQTKIVPTSYIFKSGDKIKLLIKTNKEGYLTILNIGSSGNTHVLFNEYVDASKEHEIPRKSNLRFVGKPGTEKLLVMLSNNPNPFAPSPKAPEQKTATIEQSPPSQPSAKTSPPTAPQPATPEAGQHPSAPEKKSSRPDPATDELCAPLPGLLASLEGAKDIVLEDDLETSYAVVSTKDNKLSSTNMMVESKSGSHYGVVPASALKNGILTLEIKLKHH
jgi:hypothetical protein